MKILHTVAGLFEGTGGPVASITSLCSGLAARGHEVTLLTGAGPLHPAVRAMSPSVCVRTETLGSYWLGHWSKRFRAACLEEASRADIVHDHGVWLTTNRSSIRMALRAGRPIVRSPRGMLSPWAIRRRGLLKAVLWHLVERRLFDKTTLIHATSDLEAKDVRRRGITTQMAVIPNGIDVGVEYAPLRIEAARKAGAPEALGKRLVLFLGRIHVVKGLHLLCEAWSALPSSSPALLLLAGPGDPASVRTLRRWSANQNGPPAQYIGPVNGDQKLRLLSSAWVVVLPSLSENYAMSIAEALACSTPVITSTETPWAGVAAGGCGWVIAPMAQALGGALQEALEVTPEQHETMRLRAREFVEKYHALSDTVSRMEDCYQGAISEAPACGAGIVK